MATGTIQNIELKRFETGRANESSTEVNISRYQTANGYAFLVVTRVYSTVATTGSLYLVTGYNNGASQNINQICKDTNGATVTLSGSNKINISWGVTYGGYASIIPLMYGAV